MNIYQMRHAVLARHVGQRFTPSQLKVELLQRFPSVRPQSVNASDCHYSDRKRAGSTCPECGKLGGFAVNREGVVDMGAGGWGNISPVYTPTGNVRSVSDSHEISVATGKIAISDPLAAFDWKTLYTRYDDACTGFQPNSKHLRGLYAGIPSDRFLYYKLVPMAAPENRSQLDLDWYEALLYWKHYNDYRLDSKITEWRRSLASVKLHDFLEEIPTTIPRRVEDIIKLVKLIGRYQLPGAASSTALPTRTTFLHILYPNVVPIFDQMVLRAVGGWRDGATQDISLLRQYIPHAWSLTDKYTQHLSDFEESPVRLLDMALWVKRS